MMHELMDLCGSILRNDLYSTLSEINLDHPAGDKVFADLRLAIARLDLGDGKPAH